MNNRTPLLVPLFVSLFASLLAGLLAWPAWAQEQAQESEPARERPLPDVSRATLDTIARTMGCRKRAPAEVEHGCTILHAFARAGRPGASVLQADGGLGGKRWLGWTVIFDPSPEPKFAYKTTSPFEIMIVLGARHGGNFHRKMYFSDGLGHSFISPTSDRQLAMIKADIAALQEGRRVAEDSQPAKFARSVKIEFNPPVPSTGASVFLRDDTMLRQDGNMLYILEIGNNRDGKPIYYLSQLRADTPLQ